MNVYIFENHHTLDLEPITLTRPSFEIRCGGFTCIERIQLLLPGAKFHLLVRPELEKIAKESYPGCEVNPDHVQKGIWLLGNVLWNMEDLEKFLKVENTNFYNKNTLLGAILTENEGNQWLKEGGPVVKTLNSKNNKEFPQSVLVQFLWDAIKQTGNQIERDAQYFSDFSYPDSKATYINKNQIFVHHSATINPATVIDANNGPVIIGKNVIIKSQTYLEGPLYLGEGCVLEPLTQVKGGCSIGPFCKLGGEVNKVIIQGWSNKIHDGHLGDAYIGQWVNLGAGTTNSNLKNNYSIVEVMVNGTMTNTNSRHIGCFLGDHVKTAIGTRLNTGTVIGTGSNIAMNGFPPKTIEPFSWCVGEKITLVRWKAFLETARIVKSRRGLDLSPAEEVLLKNLNSKNNSDAD